MRNSGDAILISPVVLAFRFAWRVAPFARQSRIRGVIFLIEERLLSPITTLRNMMGDTRNHNSRQSCHAASLPAGPYKVNGNPRNPGCPWNRQWAEGLSGVCAC